ncbi:alpha/beta fold hydrolase [Flavobacterium sp. Sd200]|uniref:alpha/beta hydrolase n=1 Tax=Flavobacterium sp. Sd200 TaxID=2692211 RepID=UPI00136E420E|nr:alpha/beta hydrolase [Flavobacterium sp. Sd200]MXN90622.1 alpha/beta fold hydrolase [Flavobacterium sp. Sd200]
MYLSKTIVFITGAFVSHTCWDAWQNYYKTKGYTCIAPPWPFKNENTQELRNKRPNDTDLAGLRLRKIIEHYETIIASLPEKPIVIGHSLGGLIAQILVNKNLICAGIAIHSAPPKGIFSFEWPILKLIWKPLGYFTSTKKTYMMSLSHWKKAFANGIDVNEQIISYEKYAVPESKLAVRDSLGNVSKIDFFKLHPPLLFITGSEDNLTPNSLNYENYIKYNKDNAITDYKEFKGKTHFSIALPGWQDEADYILSWLEILEHKIEISK